MLQISGGELWLGGKPVLEDITLRLECGEHVGLVGPNGSGKTSLLRILTGEYPLDRGEVNRANSIRVGYLPQDAAEAPHETVQEWLWQAFEPLNQMEREMERLLEESHALPQDSPEHQRCLERYSTHQERFQEQGGYTRESDAKKVLLGLGFTNQDWERPVSEFSGGWRMRVFLARLLLEKPDILLMDEPTNHLDPPSLHWLEQHLKDSASGVLIVSHDRYFLDRIVTSILAIENRQLNRYQGNYTDYKRLRETQLEQLLALQRNQDREIAHLQKFVDRFRAKATKARQAQSRVKRIEKIDRVEIEEEAPVISIPMPTTPRSGHEVLSLQSVEHCYGDVRALHPVEASIYRGDRIAVWGANGAGKSTLLSIMAKAFEPTQGTVTWGHNTHIAYFSQQHAELQESTRSLYDEVSAVAPPDMQQRLRDVLAAFLFRGDDVFKPVSVLSGGEKSRVALAKLLVHPCNVFILDEPLNHLDMQTVETLEQTLRDFTGTMIFVSHDRFFADRLANQIWEMHEGRLRIYKGNFKDYEYVKDQESADEAETVTTINTPSEPDDSTESSMSRQARKEQKRREAEERNRLAGVRKEKETRYAAIEEQILSVEDEISEIEQKMSDPETVRDGDAMAQLNRRYKKVKEEKEVLEVEWESIVEELEAIS